MRKALFIGTAVLMSGLFAFPALADIPANTLRSAPDQGTTYNFRGNDGIHTTAQAERWIPNTAGIICGTTWDGFLAGTPTDNAVLTMYATSSDNTFSAPGGAAVMTVNVSTTTFNNTGFAAFGSCVTYQASSTIWLVWTRSGSYSLTNFYYLGGTNPVEGSWQDRGYFEDGSSWAQTNGRLAGTWTGASGSFFTIDPTVSDTPLGGSYFGSTGTNLYVDLYAQGQVTSTCPNLWLLHGACEFAAWLLIPNMQDLAAQASSVQALATTRLPINYVYGTIVAANQALSETTGTGVFDVPLDATSASYLHVSATTSIMHWDIKNALITWVPTNTLTAFRNMMSIVMYLTFIECCWVSYRRILG